MLNLNSVTSLLSAVNPFSWLKTLYIWLGIALVFFSLGFYSGCEHKQTQWDADKLRGMEKAQKQEKSDSISGVKKVEDLKQDAGQIKDTKDYLGKQPVKPLVKVIREPAKDCVKPVEVITQPGTLKDETPTEIVYLTPNFQRLYDVSAKPKDIGLRTRAYSEEHAVEINEGFTLIQENNLICAADQARLDRLIERIEQKKKIFTDN